MTDTTLTQTKRFFVSNTFIVPITVVTVWFSLIFILGVNGQFIGKAGAPPLGIISALILPLLVFAISYRYFEGFRSWALDLDLRLLVLLHTFRTVGLGFVLLAAYGTLPWVFAIPAGFGDAIAAIGALIIAYGMYSRQGIAKRQLLAWNAFGIFDFVIAVAIGTLSRSGELLHFSGTISSDAMGSVPLVLIPGFAVPLYLITHFIVILQIRQNWAANNFVCYIR